MSKPRYTDDDGEWVYEGDTITFSFGIPPVRVTGKIMNRSGTLWVLPHNSRTEGCPLRALRGYVGALWKEEGGSINTAEGAGRPSQRISLPETGWQQTVDNTTAGNV